MANRIRFGNEAAQSIRVLACRDAFPKDLIPKAKRLAQKGMRLRMNGEVASFRVVARGLGCIPILEVRERMSGGQTARWAVYQDVNEESPEETLAAGRATPTRGHWRGGVADSWRPEESRKAGDDREERGARKKQD